MTPKVHSSYQQMSRMFFLSFLVLLSTSKANENVLNPSDTRRECIPCTFMDTVDICFPEDRIPTRVNSWRCHSDQPEENLSDSLWDCLMTGVDSDSCKEASKGSCIWCAEPVYGLCVTPEVAAKLKYLPYFSCDSNYPGKLA